MSILKEGLENLRQQLRRSGRPQSWENSLAGLEAGSEPKDSKGPGSKDQQHWQEQVSSIDSYYDSLIAPLEAELGGDGQPGNTYVVDVGLLIRELRQRRANEKKTLAEQAIRAGALPGWFR